jgi:FtsH-binding integral membrane protein
MRFEKYGDDMKISRLYAYGVVGLGLAVLAQLCWGISTSLPEWRLLGGWALMVFAIICWQRAAERPQLAVPRQGASRTADTSSHC